MLWGIWIITFMTMFMAAIFEWWRLFTIAAIIWLATCFVMRWLFDANGRGK